LGADLGGKKTTARFFGGPDDLTCWRRKGRESGGEACCVNSAPGNAVGIRCPKGGMELRRGPRKGAVKKENIQGEEKNEIEL